MKKTVSVRIKRIIISILTLSIGATLVGTLSSPQLSASADILPCSASATVSDATNGVGVVVAVTTSSSCNSNVPLTLTAVLANGDKQVLTTRPQDTLISGSHLSTITFVPDTQYASYDITIDGEFATSLTA